MLEHCRPVAGNRLAKCQPVRFGPKQMREFRAAIFDCVELR
jgi:hypothetical protein